MKPNVITKESPDGRYLSRDRLEIIAVVDCGAIKESDDE
jgi:hypothetical protein